MSQWTTLNGYSGKVKEYFLSLSLPGTGMSMDPSLPTQLFLVPQMIEIITNRSLKYVLKL